jgi:hypothetical protein
MGRQGRPPVGERAEAEPVTQPSDQPATTVAALEARIRDAEAALARERYEHEATGAELVRERMEHDNKGSKQ